MAVTKTKRASSKGESPPASLGMDDSSNRQTAQWNRSGTTPANLTSSTHTSQAWTQREKRRKRLKKKQTQARQLRLICGMGIGLTALILVVVHVEVSMLMQANNAKQNALRLSGGNTNNGMMQPQYQQQQQQRMLEPGRRMMTEQQEKHYQPLVPFKPHPINHQGVDMGSIYKDRNHHNPEDGNNLGFQQHAHMEPHNNNNNLQENRPAHAQTAHPIPKDNKGGVKGVKNSKLAAGGPLVIHHGSKKLTSKDAHKLKKTPAPGTVNKVIHHSSKKLTSKQAHQNIVKAAETQQEAEIAQLEREIADLKQKKEQQQPANVNNNINNDNKINLPEPAKVEEKPKQDAAKPNGVQPPPQPAEKPKQAEEPKVAEQAEPAAQEKPQEADNKRVKMPSPAAAKKEAPALQEKRNLDETKPDPAKKQDAPAAAKPEEKKEAPAAKPDQVAAKPDQVANPQEEPHKQKPVLTRPGDIKVVEKIQREANKLAQVEADAKKMYEEKAKTIKEMQVAEQAMNKEEEKKPAKQQQAEPGKKQTEQQHKKELTPEQHKMVKAFVEATHKADALPLPMTANFCGIPANPKAKKVAPAVIILGMEDTSADLFWHVLRGIIPEGEIHEPVGLQPPKKPDYDALNDMDPTREERFFKNLAPSNHGKWVHESLCLQQQHAHVFKKPTVLGFPWLTLSDLAGSHRAVEALEGIKSLPAGSVKVIRYRRNILDMISRQEAHLMEVKEKQPARAVELDGKKLLKQLTGWTKQQQLIDSLLENDKIPHIVVDHEKLFPFNAWTELLNTTGQVEAVPVPLNVKVDLTRFPPDIRPPQKSTMETEWEKILDFMQHKKPTSLFDIFSAAKDFDRKDGVFWRQQHSIKNYPKVQQVLTGTHFQRQLRNLEYKHDYFGCACNDKEANKAKMWRGWQKKDKQNK